MAYQYVGHHQTGPSKNALKLKHKEEHNIRMQRAQLQKKADKLLQQANQLKKDK